MTDKEEIGKHKGAVETLLHEKKELSRLLQIVNSQLQKRLKALEKAGIDTDQYLEELQQGQQRQRKQQSRKQQRSSQSSGSQENKQSQRRRQKRSSNKVKRQRKQRRNTSQDDNDDEERLSEDLFE